MSIAVSRESSAALESLTLVDTYLDGFLRVRALDAAFELGVIDAVRDGGPHVVESLARKLSVELKQLRLLTELLVRHRVLIGASDGLSLDPRFERALVARDLMEARIDYANRVSRAMIDHYAASVRDPARYVTKIIDFFLFDPNLDYSEETRVITREWVRYMSALTRYQAPICADYHDFSRYRRILDVGGNNGEFAIHLCRANPMLEVAVLDLPAVCDLGEARVAAAGLSDRITFIRHDARVDEIPTGNDAIVFKSMLHDWDDANAIAFLRKAHAALSDGAEIVVVEFHAYDLRNEDLPERDVVNVPFLSFLRRADAYECWFREIGLRSVERVEITPLHFTLTRGRR